MRLVCRCTQRKSLSLLELLTAIRTDKGWYVGTIAVSVQRSKGIRPENPAIEGPADFDGDIGSSQDVACSNEPCPGLDLLTGVVCPNLRSQAAATFLLAVVSELP